MNWKVENKVEYNDRLITYQFLFDSSYGLFRDLRLI